LRNKITVDERGDFFRVDATGRLRWSRYDETTRGFTIFDRTLATGWDRFDLIVAGTVGTLYAREPNGKLVRFRFEPGSQRWLEQNRSVGTGWDVFTKGITSAGGDVLFGIKANGELFHYRFREDNGTWPIPGNKIGSGWQSFLNFAPATNACTLTVDHAPSRPTLPFTATAPVAAMQAAASASAFGELYFGITNNNGRLYTGRQNPETGGSVAWTPEPDGSYSGTPTLVDGGEGRVRMFAQRTDSELRTRVQTTAGAATWTPWTDLGGAMVATPKAVRLSDSTLAVFGVGTDGSFWFRSQDGANGDLLPWTKLGGGGLTGALTAIALTDRTVALLATDANGVVTGARYRDGALVSPWAALGAGGLVGAPSAVIMPGPLVRVFARATDGRVVTQISDAAGAYPGVWQPVGDAAFVGTGTPAAVLDPVTDRIMVLSRATDGSVIFTRETGPGTVQWGATQDGSQQQPVASDPTPLVYQVSGGNATISYAVHMPSGVVSLWTVPSGSNLAALRSTDSGVPERVLGRSPA
jgi:hypothetical protein